MGRVQAVKTLIAAKADLHLLDQVAAPSLALRSSACARAHCSLCLSKG
jgi:hypothetical protein